MTSNISNNNSQIWAKWNPIEDALARATVDWLHVADFAAVASRFCAENDEAVRALALGLIAEVLAKKLMISGDLDRFGFHRWEGSEGESIVRVIKDWSPGEISPTPGSVAWFECTESGRLIGESVLLREES
jgi:hypothetical protein